MRIELYVKNPVKGFASNTWTIPMMSCVIFTWF